MNGYNNNCVGRRASIISNARVWCGDDSAGSGVCVCVCEYNVSLSLEQFPSFAYPRHCEAWLNSKQYVKNHVCREFWNVGHVGRWMVFIHTHSTQAHANKEFCWWSVKYELNRLHKVLIKSLDRERYTCIAHSKWILLVLIFYPGYRSPSSVLTEHSVAKCMAHEKRGRQKSMQSMPCHLMN